MNKTLLNNLFALRGPITNLCFAVISERNELEKQARAAIEAVIAAEVATERARCVAVCESRANSLMHDGPHMRIEQAGEARKCALAIQYTGNPLALPPNTPEGL